MIFTPTEIDGVWLVDLDRRADHRGFFARAWCRREFIDRDLSDRVEQTNVAFTEKRGTVRGLHYQEPPYWETKLVRSTAGAAYVVVVDLRPDSPTYTRWTATELSAANRRSLYVPEGLAQGYQTLEDQTELFYQMSKPYVPAAARGVRFDDPAFGVRWPLAVTDISERDLAWPAYCTMTATS